VETDKEMTAVLRAEFSILNEANRKKVVDMTKFLVLTQNNIIPGFLQEKGLSDMSRRISKERPKMP
jgi:hypothetical protein